jgi:hypothetical protein
MASKGHHHVIVELFSNDLEIHRFSRVVLPCSNVTTMLPCSNATITLPCNNVTTMLQRSNGPVTHRFNRAAMALPCSNVTTMLLIKGDHDQLLLTVKEHRVNRPSSHHNVQDTLPSARQDQAALAHNKGIPRPISVPECVQGIQEQRETVLPVEDSKAVLGVERVQVEVVQVVVQLQLHRKRMNAVHQSSKRNQLAPSLFHHKSW